MPKLLARAAMLLLTLASEALKLAMVDASPPFGEEKVLLMLGGKPTTPLLLLLMVRADAAAALLLLLRLALAAFAATLRTGLASPLRIRCRYSVCAF